MAAGTVIVDTELSGSLAAHTATSFSSAVSVGDLVVFVASCAAASRTYTVSDNSAGGNTWNELELSDGSVGQSGVIYWCIVSSTFTSITATANAATGGRIVFVVKYASGTFTGTPQDVYAFTPQANTANPTASTGTLAQADEQVIAVHLLSGSTSETITPGGTGTWTSMQNRHHSASTTRYQAVFEQTRAATTSVSYTPSALSGGTVDSNLAFLTLKLASTAQTISLGTIAYGGSVYGPAVNPGSFSIPAGNVPDGSSVYGPTLLPGSIPIALGTIAYGGSVYGPDVRSVTTIPLGELQSVMIRRKLGTAITAAQTTDASYYPIVLRAFQSVTPEYEMQWGQVEPTQGVFTWTNADTVVNFAANNGLGCHGHTLVWHANGNTGLMPTWVTGGTWNATTLAAALEAHITAVVNRYKDRIRTWHVVNEAFESDGSRHSWIFQSVIGNSWIEKAFQYANAADPTAELLYNDYSIDWGHFGGNAKFDAVLAMLTDFKSRGIPVHGVGIQAHYDLQYTTYPFPSDIQGVIADYAALGLRSHITELDCRIDNVADPMATRLANQATVYQNTRDAVETSDGDLTVWGLSDATNWLGSTAAGAPFDTSYVPKSAWFNIGSFGKEVPVAGLAPGAATIAAGTIAFGGSVYGPSLLPGLFTIPLGTITSPAVVYGPTGLGLTISLAAVPDGSSVFGPTLLPGTISLALGTITSSEAVYGPTLNPGAAVLALGTIAASAVVFGPTVTASVIGYLAHTVLSRCYPVPWEVRSSLPTREVRPANVAAEARAAAPTAIAESFDGFEEAP